MAEIVRIPLGADNCYLLREKGTIVIDCGMQGTGGSFLRGLRRASVEPRDVQLLVVTHGHFDHIGAAHEIKTATGAPLAMHRKEREWLEGPLIAIPPGTGPWGRLLSAAMRRFRDRITVVPAGVDIVLDNDGLPLEPYGISGRIVHTPGHSPGSVSVLLDSGEAFVGDMAMSAFPMRFTPGLPIFADDVEELKRSWRLLLSLKVMRIYPAHGAPFGAQLVERFLAR